MLPKVAPFNDVGLKCVHPKICVTVNLVECYENGIFDFVSL